MMREEFIVVVRESSLKFLRGAWSVLKYLVKYLSRELEKGRQRRVEEGIRREEFLKNKKRRDFADFLEEKLLEIVKKISLQTRDKSVLTGYKSQPGTVRCFKNSANKNFSFTIAFKLSVDPTDKKALEKKKSELRGIIIDDLKEEYCEKYRVNSRSVKVKMEPMPCFEGEWFVLGFVLEYL